MPRPRGMHKHEGIWYMADGSVAKSSQDKVNNITPMSTIAPVSIVAPEPSCGLTGVSADMPDRNASAVQSYVKNYGTRLYTNEQIKALEVQAGLVCVGFAADDHGVQIPVLLRNDHSDEEKASKLAKIRKGV